MTTTTQTHGGGAQPASIDTSGKVAGGSAQRVYGFDSEADALAAGYVCEGGPAMSVALITDAQIASGAWKAEGDPAALAVYTAPSNMPVEGGYAVPVYPVNGWGSAPAPSGPQFSSAEVGTVNASTLVVTFDSNVDASDYSAGVTIKVNGTATSITSAIRQSDNHAKVNYTIPVLWHGSGDAVTWEYASGSGNIVAESGGAALGDVTAQSVTNNCEYAALLDLQADTLALSNDDPVSLWSDQSGQGHDFTQSGSARPTFKTGYNSHAALFFNAPNNEPQWMLGSDFADNLNSFTLIAVCTVDPNAYNDIVITKIKTLESGYFDIGWVMMDLQPQLIEKGTPPRISIGAGGITGYTGIEHVFTGEIISKSDIHVYENGDNTGEEVTKSGTVTNFGNNLPVTIGVDYPDLAAVYYFYGYISAIMLLASAPSAANRAALEARLAARYGVTL